MPRTANIMEEATSRDFSGGLNVADSELNLTSKYARALENIIVGIDGSLEVRQGNKLFCDFASVSDYPIKNVRFFYRYIVAVNSRGEVFAAEGTGAVTAIWTQSIADVKRPGLLIWPSADFVTFEDFNGELIISNGVDKPLRVTTALDVDYLADLATGSNVNVPVGSVMASFNRHLCIVSNGYLLNVSERSAGGTWQGDGGATFVNQFDMRPYVTIGDTEILALIPFKGFLLVSFREVIVPVQFVEDATATPKLDLTVSGDSVLNNYGAIASRVNQDIGEMTLTVDIAGVSSIALSNFTRVLSPDRPSRFVDPLLQKDINELDVTTLRKGAFSLYDRRLSAYTLYLPNDSLALQTESHGYLYRYIDRLNLEAWSTIRGGNWGAATRSAEGRIFLLRFNDTKVFVQGDSKTDPLNADYVGEQEPFSDGTTFTDFTGFGPVADVNNSGLPIYFEWELPWADFKKRGTQKTMRYVILDTEGTGEFVMQVFIDDIYSDALRGEPFSDQTLFTDGTGWLPYSELPLTPALMLEWIGKDAGAYGIQQYGNSPYGGGNNTALRTTTLAPTKFMTTKLRFSGSTRRALKFVAITVLYQMGTIRRYPG